MKTREILSTLLEVSKSLEDQSYVREADKVHNLMVRVAQMSQPRKPVVPKGFWGNLGDALGGAGKWIGQQAAAGYKAVKENALPISNAAAWTLTPGAKLGNEATGTLIKNVQKQKQDAKRNQDYRDNEQNRYQIESFLKKYTDYAYRNLRANPTLDNLIKVRLDMKNTAMSDPYYTAIDSLSKEHNYYGSKGPVLKRLVDSFELYMPQDLKTRLATLYNRFDSSGNPTWTD